VHSTIMGGSSSSPSSPPPPQRPAKSKLLHRSFPPQQPRGLRYFLPLAPTEIPLFFQCPNCNVACFDGNVPRRLMCGCKFALLRMEDGTINAQESLVIDSFESLFHVRRQFPESPQVPKLASLTLAVFQESLPPRLLTGQSFISTALMNEVLLPYFIFKTRCLGVNDFLQIGDIRLKVTAAVPSFGVIVKETALMCHDLVSSQPLRKVLISPVAPASFTPVSFKSTVVAHFKIRKFDHLHTGQTVHLGEIQTVVEAAEPVDGVLTAETEFYYDERPLEQVQTLLCRVSNERMPASLASVPRANMSAVLRDQYLRTSFQGRHFPIHANSEIRAADVTFRVMDSRPQRGWVGSDTQVALASGASVDDPRLQLLEQLLQLSQMLEAAGAHMSGPENTHADVIASLPTRTLTAPLSGDANKCMICISEFDAGDQVTTLPCCNSYLVHFFHTSCIQQWLERSQECPICKVNVQNYVGEAVD